MSTLININSKIANDKRTLDNWEHYASSRVNFLCHAWDRTPVYLVDPDTMDRIYPPERRIFIDEDCLKEFLSAREEMHDRDRIERILNGLKECSRESSTFVALGVYCRTRYIDIPARGITITYPCIFICPERIMNSVQGILNKTTKRMTLKRGMDILFSHVLFHELAHSFMDKSPHKPSNEPWHRIIEESLANHLAWYIFNTGERWIVNKTIQGQPLEYRGCTFWQPFANYQAREIAKAWSEYGDNYANKNIIFILTCLVNNFRLFGFPPDPYIIHKHLHHFYDSHPEEIWSFIAARIVEEVMS